MTDEPGGSAGADWILRYARHAEKDISRLDPPIRRRVLDAVGALSAEPEQGKVRKLSGRPEYRLRVGDWRVLVELYPQTRTIIVKRVLPRGRAYER